MSEKKGFFNFLKLDSLFDHLTAFIESKIEIYKIQIREELAQTISKIMVWLLLASVFFFFFLFLNLALGYYLGSILNSLFYGFLIISGSYLLIFFILFLLRDTIGLRQLFEKLLIDWLKIDK
ncbi:hypothetical protein C900_04456 [Fulvivirga imtechensis AK7]|uniref:Competence protein n=1 Tax=Fulvivirga imtechensis AK7 TaxID=1237149 RepID=L8JP14_9BACT|nr:phage holin family protein [Fulvivirga imtechensis]ELR69933.1 hypothetical protein C900_04456 [Fulvivirga imtechensis AK7]